MSPSSGDVVDSFFDNSANGSVLCLHAGSYGTKSVLTSLTRSGSSGTRLVLRSYPGELATLRGELVLAGSYITVKNLNIDHFNIVGGPLGGNCARAYGGVLAIHGANDTLDHTNIYQSQRSYNGHPMKFNLYIDGKNPTISYNKIHDTGGCMNYDHGVYIGHNSGGVIHHNWIYDNPFGWCIQLYPDASGGSAQPNIYSNVCDHDGSGVIICTSGSHWHFEHNVVTNSTGTQQVPGSLWDGCGPSGTDISVVNNDQFHNPGNFGDAAGPPTNINVDPQYVDRAGKNFQVRNSALASYGLPLVSEVGPH